MVVHCSVCHAAFEDKYIVCPRCTEVQARVHYLALQRNYREDILLERVPLQLGLMEGKQHIQFIAGDPHHGLCGRKLHFSKRLERRYGELEFMDTLCAECKGQLQEIVKLVAA
jgi:hypothetical protein